MKVFLASAALIAATSSQAAVLHDNGPVVDGAGLSILASPANGTLGFGVDPADGLSISDDFFVPLGDSWSLQNLSLFAYQTGAIGFTLETAQWRIVENDPNTGTVLASGTTGVTNLGLAGYRVTTTTPTNTLRAIFELGVDIPDINLSSGHYWLTWALTGSGASGPWHPPVSDGRTGNAQQLRPDTMGLYTSAVDGTSNKTVELPFLLHGTRETNDVPVPASAFLTLLGLAGIARMQKKRK